MIVFHPTLPTTQDVPDEAVDEWLEQGWLKEPPIYDDPNVTPAYDQAAANIPAVLKHVGDSRERAIEGLAFERARGDDARPTLIAQLEKLANPASTNQEGQVV
jgi:hypothetical protein